MWLVSAAFGVFVESNSFKNLQYEGAIVAIILGVGSRLIPGIFGHLEIVQTQKSQNDKQLPYLKTVPMHFIALISIFIPKN